MTQFRLEIPDYIVIFGYFVVVLLVGVYFNKRQAASQDYFAGGHQVPWWLAGISHYMSSFSAFTFIAYSQIAYTFGWVAITLFWTTTPACAIGGLVFARRWRRARVITPVEFLERRFNAPLRQMFAWAGIPVKVFDDALKVFATALILSTGIHADLKTAIVVCGAVTITYTLLGGLWALVVTDYVQFLMKIAAMALLLPLAIVAAGGPVKAFQGLPPDFLHFAAGPYTWTYILSFTLLIIISYNATWALAQKYYSVPDEKSATKAAYTAAALNFIGTPLMLLPAIIGRKLLPDLIAQHRTADTYVLLVLQLLPVGMVGIIVAAMFSATMAAISADLNALASVLTRDFYFRMINPASSERALVRVGRLFTLALGIVVIGLSLWIAVSHQESLFHAMVTVFGLFLAPTMLPILAGLTVRWLTWKGALCGFIAGLVTGILMLCLKTWYLPAIPGISAQFVSYTFEAISIFLNIGMTALGLWLGSVIPARDAAEQARIAAFFQALDAPVTRSESRGGAGASNRPVLAAATIVVGGLLIVAGLVAGSSQARWFDLSVGGALAALGARLALARSQTPKKQYSNNGMTALKIGALILVGSFALSAQPPAADAGEWLLPNLALRLTVQVSNPSSREVRTLVTLPVSKARTVAPDFPGTLALAVLLNKPGSPTQGAVIPSQSDDLDGDGAPDQFEFPVVLGAQERRRVDIYYSMTLHDSITWPKRVHARHSYGYNREVAAIESELIGYRTYGGFFLDVMAREAGRLGLYNDAAGYVPVRRDLGTGRDVLHIGDSLGLGGIFLRRGGRLYQPPMNVPTYAHRPSPEMVPHYRVIAQGPLRAIVETELSDWNLDGDLITLKAQYAMDEGEPLVRCRFEAIPVRIASGHEYELGIGVRNLPDETSPTEAPGQLIVVGKQSERDGTLGLAVYYDPARFPVNAAVRTTESMNQSVIHNDRLAAGRAVRGEYAVAAAWKFGGIDDPGKYLADLSGVVAVQIPAGDLRFSRTPKPEKIDAEAQ